MGNCQCYNKQITDSNLTSKPGLPEGLNLDSISPRLLKLSELALSNKAHTIDIINLSQKDLGEEVSSVFETVLQYYAHIKVLLLQHTNLGQENWASLSSILSNFSSLVTLDLSSNKIGPFGAEKLACSLERLSKLENLVLNESSLEGSGMILVCGGLINLRKLRLLSLKENRIGDIGIRMLSNIINHIPFLQYLDVSHNQISIVGSNYIGKCLESLKCLQVLKAGHNFFMKEGCDGILIKLPYLITEVCLESVGMEDKNLLVSKPILLNLQKLKVLVLDHNLIGIKSLEVFSEILQKIKLKTLSLVACELALGRKLLSLASPETEIFL